MKKIIHTLAISASCLSTLVLSTSAHAHGWTDFPKARQAICAADGGFWWPADGSGIANSACRQAYQTSGSYPFVQKNEFAANVTAFSSQTAVESIVADGSLCSAGSDAKAGMDIPSPTWQKTTLAAGTHTLRFIATAPHNPSFWRIYLSKPGYSSATDSLRWSDLDLINSYDNIPLSNGGYAMDFTIPEDRTGTAILFVRWQRDDAAGEGFYNCSDIAFTNTGPNPEPDPEPTPLSSIAAFVTPAHDIAAPGDTVRFRLFNNAGNELVNETLTITANNSGFATWAEQLAQQVNGINPALIQVGAKNNDDIIYHNNTLINRVWAEQASYTASTSVLKNTSPPPVGDYDHEYPAGIGSYGPATRVLASDGQTYECKPFPYSGWCNQAPTHYAPATGLNWQDAWIQK
ncbi:Chitin-binding protein CbpD [BD1-7 clade bacterium]|uniref:Chitin-binding protein CbpD n=1 Tax=BD1-7 clade bacterium TaxID=2029982 RepID=A0A5S9QFV1_9GAMM|nr:Chitin-binding protein CbpD [BD1-7 clade bacterium]